MTSIGGKAQELIGARLLEHEKLVHKVMGSKRLLKAIEEAAGMISLTLASGGKVMFCGNGGSAADAQHWAAEIVGRFQKERPGMAALALTTDTSILTAIGNDYGYDRIFARQVEGLGGKEMCWWGFPLPATAAMYWRPSRPPGPKGSGSSALRPKGAAKWRICATCCWTCPR